MAIRALVTALAAAVILATPGFARPLEIPADQATLVRLPENAAAIVIGNPSIADAMLYDAQTIFITGKLFGRTNLIALNDRGRVIYTSDLVVTQSGRDQVQVFRNTDRFSYVCAPVCESVPQVGDNSDAFDTQTGQQMTRMQTAAAAGEASRVGTGNE